MGSISLVLQLGRLQQRQSQWNTQTKRATQSSGSIIISSLDGFVLLAESSERQKTRATIHIQNRHVQFRTQDEKLRDGQIPPQKKKTGSEVHDGVKMKQRWRFVHIGDRKLRERSVCTVLYFHVHGISVRVKYRIKWKLTIISRVWYNFQHKRKFIATKCWWGRSFFTHVSTRYKTEWCRQTEKE